LNGTPNISQVLPSGEQFFADMEIHIKGENFSANPEDNAVYFDNEKAVLISSSIDELVARRPKLTGDSITIKVVVRDAYTFATFSPYKIEKVKEEMGKFASSNEIYSIAIDRDENIYAACPGPIIFKITPNDDKTIFSNLVMQRPEQIRVAPGGYLYILTKVGKTKGYYRMPLSDGSTLELVAVIPPTKTISCMDFDQDGVLYSLGKKTGVYMLNPDATVITSTTFKDYMAFDCRVFQGYLYVAATYDGPPESWKGTAIFRAQILGENKLGPEELVLNLKANGEYAAARVLSFTFSENGDLYVGTDQANPILIVSQSGEISPVYPTLIDPSGAVLLWGNDTFLYMVRGNEGGIFSSGRIFRLRLTQKGAPYFGRR